MDMTPARSLEQIGLLLSASGRQAEALAACQEALAIHQNVAKALDLLEPMLRRAWDKQADEVITVSGFQARALAQLLPAYFGLAPQPRTFVVVADTGSGKTESAYLPINPAVRAA